MTTYFPGALGDQLSASRLTHTLFIQSFKYPIVSVFSTLIFSILMIRSPALALFGLASVRVFFFFPFFSPLLFNVSQSERRRGRGLARGHTFLLTQVFFQQAGGPAGDKAEAAPPAACEHCTFHCWSSAQARAGLAALARGFREGAGAGHDAHGTQRAAAPVPTPHRSQNPAHHHQSRGSRGFPVPSLLLSL